MTLLTIQNLRLPFNLWQISFESGTHMVFVGFVVNQPLRFISVLARNSEVMYAGISAYLMLGLLWRRPC